MKTKSLYSVILLSLFLISNTFYAQTYYGINPDTVKAQKYDMGKMWTFENPPIVNILKMNMDLNHLQSC